MSPPSRSIWSPMRPCPKNSSKRFMRTTEIVRGTYWMLCVDTTSARRLGSVLAVTRESSSYSPSARSAHSGQSPKRLQTVSACGHPITGEICNPWGTNIHSLPCISSHSTKTPASPSGFASSTVRCHCESIRPLWRAGPQREHFWLLTLNAFLGHKTAQPLRQHGKGTKRRHQRRLQAADMRIKETHQTIAGNPRLRQHQRRF